MNGVGNLHCCVDLEILLRRRATGAEAMQPRRAVAITTAIAIPVLIIVATAGAFSERGDKGEHKHAHVSNSVTSTFRWVTHTQEKGEKGERRRQGGVGRRRLPTPPEQQRTFCKRGSQ